MRILTLSTAWAGHSGGVTVNRELSLALADLGHQVTARVSVPSPAHPLVEVQGLTPVPGITDERGQLLRADGLPRNVEVIVGHGRFTGGAASYLRDQYYPQAKVVHIVHALTDELDRLRDDPMQANVHANTERLLIGKSDVAMGLGPLLTDDAARLARMSPTPPLVAEMPPGVLLGEPPVPSEYQSRLNLLLFGRSDDPLKGAQLAAEAAGRLHAEGMDLQLTVLGAQPSEVRRQERALSDVAQFPVKVKPFTPDRAVIEAEIRGADLVLMPSKHEGFGLVATEAAGFGVPVAVGSNTGAGMFFSNSRRVPEHLGSPSVVHVPPGGDEQLPQLWAEHMKGRLNAENLPGTRARALELREYLGKNYTWQQSAEAMQNCVTQLDPARLDSASAAVSYEIRGFQDRTQASSEIPPYATPAEQKEGAIEASHAFVRMQEEMGSDFLQSDHPRIAAFRKAWKSLPNADVQEASAAALYMKVSQCAEALGPVAARSNQVSDSALGTVRALAEKTGLHAERLTATHGAPPAAGPAAGARRVQQQNAPTAPAATRKGPERRGGMSSGQ